MGKATKVWPQIEAALRNDGLDFNLACTTAPRDGVTLAEKAKRAGYETLIAIGGDGVRSRVLQYLSLAVRAICSTPGVG